MEKLTPDALLYVGLDLDLPDLIRFCKSSSGINRQLCNKDKIWLEKLKRDFPDYLEKRELLNNDKTPKDIYVRLWNLRDLKQQLNLYEDIYTLYSSQYLNLSNRKLTKLPSGISFLNNLQILDVSNNKLKKLPDNLPNSLKNLVVNDNELKELPDNLPNSLEELFVINNDLKELPNSLPNSLQSLNLGNNQIKKLPELPDSLNYLSIYNNQLKKLPELPDSLTFLSVGDNQLEKLPRLPNSLEKMSVYNNQLRELPERLPISLKILYADKNQLEKDEKDRIKTLYPHLELYI